MSEVTGTIRRDAKGGVDDVVIEGEGKFSFRLERMDKGAWWLAIYYPSPHGHDLTERVAFWLGRHGKRVDVTYVEDALGCRGDTRPDPTDEEMAAEVERLMGGATEGQR